MPSCCPPKPSAEGQDNRLTAGLPTETNFDPLSEQNPDQHQEPASPTSPHMSIDDYFAPYTRLNLSETPTPPTISTTLAHLKLLEAFYILRETIAFNDGVFGIWDAWAGPEVTGNAKDRYARLKRLAQIREKRWALYVVRAADRFATWWETALCTHPSAEPRIRVADMSLPEYEHIAVDVQKVVMFADNDLPPLGMPPLEVLWRPTKADFWPDVLMVWHAFMLNPRCYLEDCIRFGLMKLWAAGMPWYCIDKVLDGGGSYQASEDTQRNFVSKTGRPWDNLVEPEFKIMDCPRCVQELSIPWTTCSGTEHSGYDDKDSLVGSGFAESDLSHRCPACRYKVTHDSLRVVNFMEDAEAMFTSDWPLKGTLLFGRHGTPRVFDDRSDTSSPQGASFVFANIVVRELMREEIHDLIPQYGNEPSGMGRIRDILEGKIQGRIREERARSLNYRIPREERLSIRKMMSRYWDNHSPFALDLSGAVIRQCKCVPLVSKPPTDIISSTGVFVVKMHNIDWLHSPAARNTMDRLIMKYHRFFEIIALYPCECAVPTLDVDLVWHTHQLSPQDYYEYSVEMTGGKFIDHDDKIDENDLNTSFEWTSKTYQERYKEAYSDCTCWYCEGNSSLKPSPQQDSPSHLISSHSLKPHQIQTLRQIRP